MPSIFHNVDCEENCAKKFKAYKNILPTVVENFHLIFTKALSNTKCIY